MVRADLTLSVDISYILLPQMFNLEKPTRVIASVAFLGFTGLIFVGAFVIDNGVRLQCHTNPTLAYFIGLQIICISKDCVAFTPRTMPHYYLQSS